MISIAEQLGRGWSRFANWLTGCGLAHFFVLTRYHEREIVALKVEIAYWRQLHATATQATAEQAARFAEERKDLLDRLLPKPVVQAEGEKADLWKAIADELGIDEIAAANPLARRVNAAKWEDELRYRQQTASFEETLGEVQQAEYEEEARVREDFAKRAAQAAANTAGAV